MLDVGLRASVGCWGLMDARRDRKSLLGELLRPRERHQNCSASFRAKVQPLRGTRATREHRKDSEWMGLFLPTKVDHAVPVVSDGERVISHHGQEGHSCFIQ